MRCSYHYSTGHIYWYFILCTNSGLLCHEYQTKFILVIYVHCQKNPSLGCGRRWSECRQWRAGRRTSKAGAANGPDPGCSSGYPAASRRTSRAAVVAAAAAAVDRRANVAGSWNVRPPIHADNDSAHRRCSTGRPSGGWVAAWAESAAVCEWKADAPSAAYDVSRDYETV